MNYETITPEEFIKHFKHISKLLLIKCQNAFLVIDHCPSDNDGQAFSLMDSEIKTIVESVLPGIWENHPIFRFNIETESWDRNKDLIVRFEVTDLRNNKLFVEFDVEEYLAILQDSPDCPNF